MQRTRKLEPKQPLSHSKPSGILYKPKKASLIHHVKDIDLAPLEEGKTESQPLSPRSFLGKTNLQELRLQRAMDRLNTSNCSSPEGSALQKLSSVETIWNGMKLQREKNHSFLNLTAFSRSADTELLRNSDEIMKLTRTAKDLLESIREDRGDTCRKPTDAMKQNTVLGRKGPEYLKSSNTDLLSLIQSSRSILKNPVKTKPHK